MKPTNEYPYNVNQLADGNLIDLRQPISESQALCNYIDSVAKTAKLAHERLGIHAHWLQNISIIVIIALAIASVTLIMLIFHIKSAHAELPPLDIPNKIYSHPTALVVVDKADGWSKCKLNKQCLAELAADIGKDTRTLVFFESPRSFYVDGCIGNEVCYAGGPIDYINRAVNATYGWNESEGDVSRESVEDDFNFSINYSCQYLRKKAHRRIGRVKNPDECYARLATQSRRECIRDLFSPRYSCGYHAGETKNQWSAFVTDEF